MNLTSTPIAGVFVAETKVIGDERGHFMRLFCDNELNFPEPIKQINFSYTAQKGTIRGMHFQKAPALECKMVRCIEGAIYDVAVDLRADSPTYLQHFATELSGENNHALIIPAGCAHGFQALTDHCKMIYCHTNAYAPEHEDGVRFDDPKLAIAWPLPAANLSTRDYSFRFL